MGREIVAFTHFTLLYIRANGRFAPFDRLRSSIRGFPAAEDRYPFDRHTVLSNAEGLSTTGSSEKIAELISFYRCRASEPKGASTQSAKKPLTSESDVRGGSTKS